MEKKQIIIGVSLLLIVGGIVGYSLFSYNRTLKNIRASEATHNARISALEENSAKFEDVKTELETEIAALQRRSDLLSENLINEQTKSNNVAATIGQVSSTLGTLEKLSKTDPELLQQYSKVYFLNEHYVPVSLLAINPKYIYTPGKTLQIHADVAQSLDSLLRDAAASGMSLNVESAYRSFGTQAQLKSSYKITYGAGTANSFSAEQGYSEHQLGTAVDFTTVSLKGTLGGFDKTIEYQWLQNNAYRYGFVISYPANNPSYVFEPWHWRYVGKALANYIHQNNTFFYKMDQRQIDTYLANIFD